MLPHGAALSFTLNKIVITRWIMNVHRDLRQMGVPNYSKILYVLKARPCKMIELIKQRIQLKFLSCFKKKFW